MGEVRHERSERRCGRSGAAPHPLNLEKNGDDRLRGVKAPKIFRSVYQRQTLVSPSSSALHQESGTKISSNLLLLLGYD